MPGLGQLGTLVAIGIAVAAVMMSYAYLPPLIAKGGHAQKQNQPKHSDEVHILASRDRFSKISWLLTLLLILAGIPLLLFKPPPLDKSPDSLKPKNSQAYAALDELKLQMNRSQEPLWVVVEGRNEQQVEARLKAVEPILANAASNHAVANYTMPTMLWPSVEHQQQNRSTAVILVNHRDAFHRAAEAAGFAGNSLAMTDGILNTWQRALGQKNVFWPTNENSRWILEKLTARPAGKFLAVGLIHLDTNAPPRIAELAREVRGDGMWLSGWDLLGPTVSGLVIGDMPRVVIPILVLVIGSLWLAFRNWREVMLSLITVAVAGILLELLMSLLGWTWNMMNLMSVPLLLGFRDSYATGDAATFGRPAFRPPDHRAGVASGRFDDGGWLRLRSLFFKCRTGQPGQGVWRWNQLRDVDGGFPVADLVGEICRKSSQHALKPRLVPLTSTSDPRIVRMWAKSV